MCDLSPLLVFFCTVPRGERGENKRANASAVTPYRLLKTDNFWLSVFFVFYNAELAINGLLGYSGVEANFLICNKKREELAFFSFQYPLRGSTVEL